MGAALDQLRHAANIIERECNAVSDNPLVFADQGDIVSGGNFHAEPVALAADGIALAIAEIGAISERRTALLTDARMSNLPAFLSPDPGLNSGFMIAHVTAAALASENKLLAHPASVDSLPTSANQEDHVSMATHGARRLHDMADNTAAIVGIELLAAAQGIELRKPVATSPRLQTVLCAAARRHSVLGPGPPDGAGDRSRQAPGTQPSLARDRGTVGDLTLLEFAHPLTCGCSHESLPLSHRS